MTQPHKLVPVGKCIYILSNHHRNKQNRNKSQWVINQIEEVESFELMIVKNNWVINNNKGWSLHRENRNTNSNIGVSVQNEFVQIAKFVDSSNNQQWHGYPIDYRMSVNDRPHIAILQNWVDQGIIKKRDKARILQGKGCKI